MGQTIHLPHRFFLLEVPSGTAYHVLIIIQLSIQIAGVIIDDLDGFTV